MKVLVTGSNGLVGSAIVAVRNQYPEFDFYFATRKDGDLTNKNEVADLYKRVKPQYVIHAAAKVGGLGCNLRKPAEMFYENILMNTLMIHYAYLNNVEKLMCFSSLCTFPHDIPILSEEMQQVGAPYVGNYAYGYAKRMADVQIQSYREQYGVNYTSLILTNIYGPHDNWDLDDGHVVPSLIHKCFLAKQNNTTMTLWGNGSAVREFIFSEDIAKCALGLLRSKSDVIRVIISSGEACSIKEICEHVCEAMDFQNKIVYDRVTSDGQSRRICDNSLLRNLLPDMEYVPVKDGIKIAADWFCENYPNVRL